MTDDDTLRRRARQRIEALGPTRDGDALGNQRADIARLYREAGDKEEAITWYLEAAAQAEFSEQTMICPVYFREALVVDPTSARALAARERFSKKWGFGI